MEQEQLDVVIGHTEALSMVLTVVISALPAVTAAEAAVRLAMAREQQREEDQSQSIPPATVRAREGLIDGYLSLLSAATQQG